MSLRVTGLHFPFQRERKTTLSRELKIELRAGQGCGLEGGRGGGRGRGECSFLGQRSSGRPGWGLEGGRLSLPRGAAPADLIRSQRPYGSLCGRMRNVCMCKKLCNCE